jgi:N-acetylglucosamine malate deacetylase 2
MRLLATQPSETMEESEQDMTEGPFAGRRVLLVVAHPDDEVLFAGAQLSQCRELCIVHLTDGAPSNTAARGRGFSSRPEYAKARYRELHAALEIGGIHADCRSLGFRDQYSCLKIPEIVTELVDAIAKTDPDVVLTHCYEGGHRDHDTAAFAVQLAAEYCAKPLSVWDMACYHFQDKKFRHHVFPGEDKGITQIILTKDQVKMKRKMLECFVTERKAVSILESDHESFRVAPQYDFNLAPVIGRLNYESNGFGFESALWRLLARNSREVLLRPSLATSMRAFILGWAMKLMIGTARARGRHPRMARPLEQLLLIVCSGLASDGAASSHQAV